MVRGSTGGVASEMVGSVLSVEREARWAEPAGRRASVVKAGALRVPCLRWNHARFLLGGWVCFFWRWVRCGSEWMDVVSGSTEVNWLLFSHSFHHYMD